MTTGKWKLLSLVLLVGFVSLLGYVFLQGRSGQNAASPDAVVMEVQKLSQLVTVRYKVARVVAMTEEKDPLGAESILLMVEGEIQAGVDLHQVNAGNVLFDPSGALTLTLPLPTVFHSSLDESKTKVWDRHVTWWTPWVAPDPDLEHKARLKAIEDIRKAALDMGILEQARNNAQSALRELLGAVGWKVTVKFKSGD